jgi:uncharacterized protein YjbI with pentapeptide repeats
MRAEIKSNEQYFDQVFEKVNLGQGEIKDSQFSDCTFKHCIFTETVIRTCRFNNCIFKDCDLSLAQLPGSSFPATKFDKSKLIGINWTHANWKSTGFGKLVGFSKCALSHATFIGLDLEGVQIKKCVAVDVDFREANLTNVDFSGTDLTGSLFVNTNLTEADLSTAKNYTLNPGENILTKAKFSMPEALSLLYGLDIELQEDDDAW